jgi:YVTN family beta-propeller protein
VEGLTDGTYSLTAAGSDNSSAVRVENIKIAGRNIHLKTVRMNPVGLISGIVKLEGATDHIDVRVNIPGTSLDAYTATDGSFIIYGAPEGTYDVRASKTSYGTITLRDIPVESGTETVLEEIKLPSVVGSVSGSVWLQGALDYTGILITLKRDVGRTYITATDSIGNYTFSDVPTGEYKLTAAMAGYTAGSANVMVSTGANNPSPLLLAINTSKGNILGTAVLNDFNNHSGILVGIYGTHHLAVTDVSGSYRIGDVPQGSYTVYMKAEGYGAEKIDNVLITSGQTTALSSVTLVSKAGTANVTNGSIVGSALYSENTDHSGINIKVEGTDIPLCGTDRNGAFIIKDVPAGEYTLLFTQANYKSVNRRGIRITPWETAFVRDVRMIPPVGSVRGTVEIEDTNPTDDVYADVQVYASYVPDGTSAPTYPSRTTGGRFLLENVKEGIVTIHVTKPGYVSSSVAEIRVIGGQTTILEQPLKLMKPPEPPTGLSLSQSSGSSIIATFTASTAGDVIGYNVYYGTSSSAIATKANTAIISGTTFEVTGLEKGITYYFAAEAVDQDGLTSVLSQYGSTVIVPTQPLPPKPSEIMTGGFPFIMPESICLSRDGTKGYVTNPDNNVVSLVDMNTASVIGLIPVQQRPRDLCANPARDEIYCVNQYSNSISIITSSTDDPYQAVIATMATANFPSRCLASPDGNYLFVSSTGSDIVSIIDLDTRTEIQGSRLTVGNDPQGMAVAQNKLYVANQFGNTVSVIDIATWQKMTYTIPVGSLPQDIAARPDGAYIYVCNSESDDISIINTATDTVEITLPVCDNPVRLTASGDILYVTSYNEGKVYMVNMKYNLLLPTVIGVGIYPKGIAVSADGETIYVANEGSESVSIREY